MRSDDIALVGVAARFPGARDVEEYWSNLVAERECITTLDEDDLRARGVPEDHMRDASYVRVAPLVPEVEAFDHAYFDLTPRDAALRDPQHRLWLEACSAALEDAGYGDPSRAGNIGVFGGTANNRYGFYHLGHLREWRVASPADLALDIANNTDYLATFTAYKLGLGGPCVTISTACSSSLVAVHLACQSLREGDSDMALAGGVTVEIPYGHGYRAVDGGILSPDGHCRAFDADAAGTVFGSGVGVVVLKLLDRAVADRDTIRAVIRGSAVNNDGARKAGFSAPGLEGQKAAIGDALLVAGVSPDEIGYVEAHGTGTALGDPVEVAALAAAWREAGCRSRGATVLGSVKTNIGHAGAAAGIAGLVKAALVVEHGLVPGTLHFRQPNPRLELLSTPFRVSPVTEPFPGGSPRLAAVSAFGIGGTNAHVILQQAAPRAPRPAGAPQRPRIVVLSAKTAEALASLRERTAATLRHSPAPALDEVAATLAAGRRPHRYRVAVVAGTAGEAAAGLEGTGAPAAPAPARRVALLLPGQGSESSGMGRALYRDDVAFRDAFDEVASAFERAGVDVRAAAWPAAGEPGPGESTTRAQPALFAVSYATVRCLEAWGVAWDAAIGHSLGELVVACLAGVFDLATAVDLVTARARLTEQCKPGRMLAVPLAAERLAPDIGGTLGVAAINGPAQTVVSGDEADLAALRARLEGQGVRCRLLPVVHAFHSPLMEPAAAQLAGVLATASLRPPGRPFLSTVTGDWAREEHVATAGYWTGQLRAPVRWWPALGTLLDARDWVLIDTGPGRVCTGLARRHPAVRSGRSVVLSCLPRPEDPAAVLDLARAAGAAWAAGAAVDVARSVEEGAGRVPLPTYPFARTRCWVDPPQPRGRVAAEPDAEAPATPHSVPVWVGTPPSAGQPPAGSRPVWLVLDPHGVTAALEAALRDRGEDVRRLEAVAPGGEEAALRDEHTYGRVVGALDPGTPLHVVNAVLAGPDPAAATPSTRARDARESGFGSLLALLRALGRAGGERSVEVSVLSTGAYQVGGEPTDPFRAVAAGPCLVGPAEMPGLRMRHVDSDRAGLAAADPTLVAELLHGEEPLACIRAGQRYSRRWLPYEPAAETAAALRERGTYLITGGLGGLGLAVAAGLARGCRARLVLVGRSGLPPREEWARLPAGTAADRARAVRELEALGAEVLVCQADVASVAEVRRVREQAERAFGPVDGVFHAAGVAGGGLAAVRRQVDADEVLRPKVDGVAAIEEVFGDGLDLLVLFSSVTAVAGGVGQADYCGANAVLDAHAHAARARGRRVLSVNWAGWAEVGMAAAEGARRSRAASPAERWPRVAEVAAGVVETILAPDDWVVDEHRLHGRPLLPGTAYLDLVAMVAGGAAALPLEIRDVAIVAPLWVDEPRTVRVTRTGEASEACRWEITSRPAGAGDGEAWTEHAHGTACPAGEAAPQAVDLPDLSAPAPAPGPSPLALGPNWDALRGLAAAGSEPAARVELPASPDGGHVLHPAALDVALNFPESPDGTSLPFALDRLVVWEPLPQRLVSLHGPQTSTPAGRAVRRDVLLCTSDGRPLARVEGLALRRLDPGALGPQEDAPPRRLIPPQEGVTTLLRLLSDATAAQVVVAPGGLAERLQEARTATAAAAAQGAPDGADRAAPPAPQPEPAPAGERADGNGEPSLLGELRELWRGALGVSEIGLDDDFFDLGADSLVALEVVERIQQAFDVELPLITLFERPTLRELAEEVTAVTAGSAE